MNKLKIKAINLRKKGFSYGEIKKEIDVPKSTLSYWLKTVPLNSTQKKRLYTKNIINMAKGPQSQKQRREREISKIVKNAEEEVALPISFESYRLIGAFLYWAEGRKTKHFEITNSDPSLILFMVKWIEEVLMVPPSQMKASINIYSQQNDQDLKKFWSQLTKIPLENFGKSFVKPPNKRYKKNNLYYGTVKIRVLKGTDFRHRVYGWIKAVLKDVDPHSELVQKKWKSLREVPRPVNITEE
ncbi:MAG: hypothetical protein K9M12_01700 [Candidatus Pacebacteria bacterium]|nr:hypothetical protein [Candidatus Paceibacterota bacterium]